MTEQDYIALTNLTKIRTLLPILFDLMTGEEIPEPELNMVGGLVIGWRDALEKKLKVE